MRSAISACARVSKTDGPQSPDLQRYVLETAGVDALNGQHDLVSGVEAQPDLDRDAALHRPLRLPEFVTATELVTMLVKARQQGPASTSFHGPLLCLKGRSLRRDRP